jgi:uncharacterized membrane protein YfcA
MQQYILAALIGLLGGVTSGLFGVGGGVIMVPAMLLALSPPIRDVKMAIGTSLAVIIPTAMWGTFRHNQLDNVHWVTAALLIPGALIGSDLGTKLTKIISAGDLKRVFGIFLVAVGIKLIFFKSW